MSIPAIASGAPCVNDTAGMAIKDASGNCGFPGFDGMLASNTLGYVAQMQESGVPVTYGYISDVHDHTSPTRSADSYVSTAGRVPARPAHEAQLTVLRRRLRSVLQRPGRPRHRQVATRCSSSPSMRATTSPGGPGCLSPTARSAYSHTPCAVLTSCPPDQIGEVNANLAAILPAGEHRPSSVHSDDAPTVYVNGQPAPTDPSVRKLERDVAQPQAPDPYVNGGQNPSR